MVAASSIPGRYVEALFVFRTTEVPIVRILGPQYVEDGSTRIMKIIIDTLYFLILFLLFVLSIFSFQGTPGIYLWLSGGNWR